jgi:hypothetical protein
MSLWRHITILLYDKKFAEKKNFAKGSYFVLGQNFDSLTARVILQEVVGGASKHLSNVISTHQASLEIEKEEALNTRYSSQLKRDCYIIVLLEQRR